MNDWDGYCACCAAAYVRGEAVKARAHGGRITTPDGKTDGSQLVLPPELTDTPLEALAVEQIKAILMRGGDAGLKLYRFKKNLAELPRVKYALDYLRAQAFDTLLDVGSGRGAFLWPCLNALPHVKVRSVELSPSWGNVFDAVRLGGMSNFSWTQSDFCKLDDADCSYDVVTLFEVLGHIVPVACAVQNAVRLAKKYIIVSAQTRPDDNPEHIHLLTEDVLTRLFRDAGCTNLRFEGVNDHLMLIASKEG